MIFPVGGRLLGVKFYISSTTWTRPENCTSILVAAIGGGGGGSVIVNGAGSANGSPGGTTSFGSAISCGGGGGGTAGGANGARGTITTDSNIVSLGGSKFNTNSPLFGYGAGGHARQDAPAVSTVSGAFSGHGGSGGLSVVFIKESLLDSYSVTIGSGGAGATVSSSSSEAGNAGAVLVIEFGG